MLTKPPYNLLQAPRWSLHLCYGKTALVQVVPNELYPNMYRLAWPSGEISDLANLSRIKDAAAAICERGPPHRDAKLLLWKQNHLESPRESRLCSLRAEPVEAHL